MDKIYDKIYIFGIRDTTTKFGDICGFAVDGLFTDHRDGKKKPRSIAHHLCSSEISFKEDMGITSGRKHDIYEIYHPDGYDLEVIGIFNNINDALSELEGRLEIVDEVWNVL